MLILAVHAATETFRKLMVTQHSQSQEEGQLYSLLWRYQLLECTTTEGAAHLFHGVDVTPVLGAQAHKVDRQVQVIHVVCHPGVRRQALSLQPVVHNYNTVLQEGLCSQLPCPDH